MRRLEIGGQMRALEFDARRDRVNSLVDGFQVRLTRCKVLNFIYVNRKDEFFAGVEAREIERELRAAVLDMRGYAANARAGKDLEWKCTVRAQAPLRGI